MTGLYIHIPFCVSKCVYCDFLSFASQSENSMRQYTDALVNEINSIRKKNLTFDTVYIGGGTPTALPSPFLLEVTGAVNGLDLLPEAEFTVEVNPGTLGGCAAEPAGRLNGGAGFNILAALCRAGVNRLSFGLQAWQDPLLKSLGRIHTRDEFVSNYRAAVSAGITNISVDAMFALPGQTMAMWEETLAKLIRLKPKHISAYSLTPEEGTPLWRQIESGEVVLPGDDADREMYHAARKILSVAGYVHYELSNFALPGYESKHNTRYWKRRPYLGAGLGAHSFDGRARWHNTEDFSKYVSVFGTGAAGTGGETASAPSDDTEGAAASAIEDMEIISASDARSEEMFLGLRLMEGVPYNPFYAKETEALIKRGLLKRGGNKIALTELGMDLANQVFASFL